MSKCHFGARLRGVNSRTQWSGRSVVGSLESSAVSVGVFAVILTYLFLAVRRGMGENSAEISSSNSERVLAGAVGMTTPSRAGVRVCARFLGINRASGYVARWDQLDLSSPERLRISCPVEDLRRE